MPARCAHRCQDVALLDDRRYGRGARVMASATTHVTPSAPPAPTAPLSSGPAWHTLDATAAAIHLAATSTGLDTAEAAQRLTSHGPNELHVQARESAWRTLAAQFQNVLIVI